jgi:hypothetical protein
MLINYVMLFGQKDVSLKQIKIFHAVARPEKKSVYTNNFV